ncbi:MAG: hypothetical protein WBF58_06205 [Xanthobacteraceae bacterium]
MVPKIPQSFNGLYNRGFVADPADVGERAKGSMTPPMPTVFRMSTVKANTIAAADSLR